MAKKENTASVLSFEKKLVPSDGRMYGTIMGSAKRSIYAIDAD